MAENVVFRKLLASERGLIREHLLRLTPADRRLRFFGSVGDAFVASYCDHLVSSDHIVVGGFIGGTLRAVGKIRNENGWRNRSGELAISVESAYQNRGIGTALLAHLITIARNRSLKTLHLFCMVDNLKMRRVARKLGGMLKFADGAIVATIDPPRPSYWSLLEEALVDGRAMLGIWSLARTPYLAAASNDNRGTSRNASA